MTTSMKIAIIQGQGGECKERRLFWSSRFEVQTVYNYDFFTQRPKGSTEPGEPALDL